MIYSVKQFPCNHCRDKGKKRIVGSKELTFCHCLSGMRLKLGVYRQALDIQPNNERIISSITWITKAIQNRLTYKLSFYIATLSDKYKIRRVE